MTAFIEPPKRIPFYLRPGIWLAKKIVGREVLPAKLLAWYPKAAISSGILEALIAHHEPNLDERMLKLVRLQASFTLGCAFCIDMNFSEHAKYGITADELAALQGRVDVEAIASFSDREKTALEYARLISRTPLSFPDPFVETLKAHFSERDIVVLATTVAQVNYWSRLIQALGIPPMGYSEYCELNDGGKSWQTKNVGH
ncbi:MAG: carboxymuconolactone decarboxylase family protein [Chloroflexi bacterium]|nr:carboxymuconolactone decarboxylase family protein [Chloroflexota bacterium]